MTILELIIAQCLVQGVDRKYAERIEKASAITEEKDGNIIAAVKGFKENILPVIQEAENSGKKTIEEYEKKHGLKDGKPVESGGGETKGKKSNESDEVSDLRAMVTELTKAVSSLTESQKRNSNLEVVKAKLKGKIDDDFIEDYASRVKLDAENIDSEIENAVKSFTDAKQRFLNKAVESGNYIPASGGGIVKDDKDIDAFIESKSKPAESGFTGIKI